MADEQFTTAAALQERARQEIAVEWEQWNASLPSDAPRWRLGAAYLRDSAPGSLIGDAIVNQLKGVLLQMQNERIYVPFENIYFENVSGTELRARREFMSLLEQAEAGKFSAIAAYISSRLFRNMEEAIAVKRRLRLKGVKLFWMGRPQIDERDPQAWAMERQIELADELHSRQTGFLVALAKEQAAARGYPTGPLPDGYRIADRGPSLPGGRRGRPIRWEVNEPWASVLQEGCRRYLAGASYNDLVVWCRSTEVKGLNAKGRPMTAQWWRLALLNPKYAGLQPVRRYQGYKPGKESPARERDVPVTQMVASVLPPLWPQETYEKLLAVSASRWTSGKFRTRYRQGFWSGLLRHAMCGHNLQIYGHGRPGVTELRLRCRHHVLHDSPSFRAHDSIAELDELLGGLDLTDSDLVDAVAVELASRVVERPRLVPAEDHRRQDLLAAMENLKDPSLKAVRDDLAAMLMKLPDEPAVAVPIDQGFAAAIDDLHQWSHVWKTGSPLDKNRLLRAAGMEILIRPLLRPLHKVRAGGRLSEIVEIRVKDPYLGLALAAVLGDRATLVRDPERYVDISSVDVLPPTKCRAAGPIVIELPQAFSEALDRARSGLADIAA